MVSISTISELLVQSDSQFRIYDLGRKITKISKSDFIKIEQAQLAYPFPAQGHAFIAVIFWQKISPEPYLWFVKLPLDERGLLNQSARDHFVAIIVEALALKNNSANLSITPNAQQEALLKNNPYHFTPSQYKLASLNSIIKVELKQKPSQHYQDAHNYLSGKLAWHNWQNIAVQGLTDIGARITQDNNEQLLTDNIKHLPEQVLLPLAAALENQSLSFELITAIITRLLNCEANSLLQQHLLRALASSCQHPHVQNLIIEQLKLTSLDDDMLIVISGRCWLALQNEKITMLFLEKLVLSKESSLFAAIFKDLIAIPLIRPVLFTCMRRPNRSKPLAQAIGHLFNQLRT
jgi:uncharacterized protein DUF3549